MLKDLYRINKASGELGKTWDPAAQMRRGIAQMQVASQALEQQVASYTLSDKGERAEAQVLDLRETGMQLNLQPMFELDLMVLRPGLPPYPVTIRQVVSLAHAGMVVPGATLPVV